jgi:serine/threonine-protein kinase
MWRLWGMVFACGSPDPEERPALTSPPTASESGSAATGCAAAGVVCTVMGRPGLGLNSGPTGQGLSFGLHFPVGIAIDPAGVRYVADESNHRVVRQGADGRVETVAGIGFPADSVEGPLAGSALHGPTALAWSAGPTADHPGMLTVALRGSNRVVRLDLGAQTLSWVAGTGARAYDGDGAATEHALALPRGVAVGADGTVVVADTENALLRSIGLDGVITTLAGQPGEQAHRGDGGPGVEAALDAPVGVAVVGDAVFVAEAGAHTIRRLDRATGEIRTWAGAAGQMGTADGVGAAARFAAPTGLAVDGAGGLLVTEELNHCIRRIDLVNAQVTTLAGRCGEGGFAGDGGPALEALFSSPMGVAVGPDGSWVVADTANQIVRAIHR